MLSHRFLAIIGSTYPTLARNAARQSLIFLSTWECEQGFSALMAVKSKSRNRITEPKHDFRCAVSKVAPRIDQLVQKKQLHLSHKIVLFVIYWCYGKINSARFEQKKVILSHLVRGVVKNE